MTMTRVLSTAGLVLVAGATALAAQQPLQGQLLRDTVHSKSLEGNLYGDTPDRSMAVYLPPSYSSSPNKRYPVVYLLHGFGGGEGEWITLAPVKQAMDSLLQAGTVHEMIVVMPNGRNALDGSFFTNSTTTGNWDDFITKDLVAYVDKKFRTLARPESRGLGGHSMGGYGTFAIGMRHGGDVYGAIYALSACCTHFARVTPSPEIWQAIESAPSLADARRLPFYPKVFAALSAAFAPDPKAAPLFADFPFVPRGGKMEPVPAVQALWEEHAPLDMIATHIAQLKRLRGIMFDVGTSDQLVPPSQIAAMDSALTRAGVAHSYETYDGDHTNRIALRLFARVLPFFSKTLDFGDAPRR